MTRCASYRDKRLNSREAGRICATLKPDLGGQGSKKYSTKYEDGMRAALTMARPLRSGVKYVEVTTTAAWYGTRLTFEGVDGYECLGFQVDCRANEDARELCFIRLNGSQVNYLWIKSLGDDSWTWCNEPVVFGVLVDMVRGCVTFGINGIDGPCVRFSSVSRRGGVHIRVSHLPMDTSTPSEVVVSCATPPPPPSLLEAAATPLTGAEHVAAGSMEYDTDLFDWDDEDEDERDDEGESDDEDESDDD